MIHVFIELVGLPNQLFHSDPMLGFLGESVEKLGPSQSGDVNKLRLPFELREDFRKEWPLREHPGVYWQLR